MRQRADIIQFFPDATLVIDKEGKVTAWNRAMEELTGVPATEMLGKGEYEYALPFYGVRRPILIDLVTRPVAGAEKLYPRLEWRGKTLFGEAYIEDMLGKQLFIQSSASVLRNSQGEVIGAIESIRDISGRKQMEDQLRALSCGVEQSPASIVFTDRDGNIEYVNPKFTQLTGYTIEEAIGQNPRILKSGLTPPEIHRQLWETILAGSEWHGEFCNRKKNGDLYWEFASISPVADTEGNITRFIAVKEDITERKRAEIILAEKERMISGILDGIQDGICMLDEELRIVRVNPFFERYSAKMPFLGQKCHEVFWSSSEPCENCPSLRTLQSGERASMVFSDNQSGENAWFELETFPLLDPEKLRVTGVVEYLREITERKQMEERAAYLASFPQLNPNPVLEVDSAGKVTFFNPAAQNVLETLGVEREDFTVFFPADMQQILEDLDKQEELTFCRELRVKNRVFFEDIYIAPQFFAGARFFIRDISDRILVEEEVIALNAELERKVDSKTRQLLEAQEELVRREKLAILGRLSGSVGHELRNPLGVMSNAVYFLKMVLTEANDTTKEYLDIIKHEIDNSERIISDLLDFARTRTPQIKTVTARQLLDGTIGKCVIPENVELHTDLPDTLPLLKVDPLQMEQVFQNLITNAIQAMPEGGTLRLAANSKLKTQNSKLDGDCIEISVADSGEGISPENMNRLFQPLFTTKAKGIGLGLVVCSNLVEANGGKIEVESRLGEETTFTIILPVKSG